MFLSQIKNKNGDLVAVARIGDRACKVNGLKSVYGLAQEAIRRGVKLEKLIDDLGFDAPVDLEKLYTKGLLALPISHPDPAHMHLTGTGLTHLGSAATRDAMHAGSQDVTDSMKMFRMGLQGGKPEAGKIGVQPEWFYKGFGAGAVEPGQPLKSPSFALNGGEEPEIAGIYINSDNGIPHRIGFALANEFSDHAMEQINYLYLSHSKLRQTSFGPEIRLGPLPEDIRGTSRILRGGKAIWEKPFLSGEKNMSHSIDNLEHHHFKYALFRQPRDVHVHMFGTATLSFADNIEARAGDVFEITAPDLGLPLRNPLEIADEETIHVKEL